MNKIETNNRAHALIETTNNTPDEKGRREGRTRCGRTVKGHTGACVVTLIDCAACRQSLRREGFQV